MEREELDMHLFCAACGALVAEVLSPIYEFGEDGVLCWDCALQRGGSHDAEHDRWLVTPNTSDLARAKENA